MHAHNYINNLYYTYVIILLIIYNCNLVVLFYILNSNRIIFGNKILYKVQKFYNTWICNYFAHVKWKIWIFFTQVHIYIDVMMVCVNAKSVRSIVLITLHNTTSISFLYAEPNKSVQSVSSLRPNFVNVTLNSLKN